MNIRTIENLLEHYPRQYVDRTNITSLFECKDKEPATIKVQVESIHISTGYRTKKSYELTVQDETGKAEIVFFNSKYLKNMFEEGHSYYFYGVIKNEFGRISLVHPEFTKVNSNSKNPFLGIIPVYGLTEGLIQKEVRMSVKKSFRSSATGVLKKHSLNLLLSATD